MLLVSHCDEDVESLDKPATDLFFHPINCSEENRLPKLPSFF